MKTIQLSAKAQAKVDARKAFEANRNNATYSKIVGKTKEEINAHIENVRENEVIEKKETLDTLLKENVKAQDIFNAQLENQKNLLK